MPADQEHPVVIVDLSGSDAVVEVRSPTDDERAAMAAAAAAAAERERVDATLADEDADRLRLVDERSADDAAFRALAELALRGRR